MDEDQHPSPDAGELPEAPPPERASLAGGDSPWTAPALLAVLGFAVYGASLGGGFLNWDDPKYVPHNPELQLPFWEAVGRIFSTSYFTNYNPLQRLTYLIEWKTFGDAPSAFRVTNLVLHIVNGVLVHRILRNWLGNPMVALAGAALFVVHPGAVESVAWISSRKTVLAATFAFGALLAWQGADERPRRRWIALGLFILALLSKVSVVVLPVGIGLLDLASRKRLRWGWYAAFCVPSAVFAVIQVNSAGSDAIRALHGGTLASHVATIVAVMPAYAGSILLPFGHAARRGFEPVVELTDPRLWGGIALIAGAAWVAAASWRGKRYALVAIAWSLVVLLPTLVVPIPIIHADRYVYLALPFVAGLCAALVARVEPPAAQTVRFAAAGLAIWFGLAGGLYASVWDDSAELWKDSLATYPSEPEAWVLLGVALGEEENLPAAALAYEEGLRLDPTNLECSENLAIICLMNGKHERAETLLRTVIAEAPDRDTAWAALAAVLDLTGRTDEAEATFEKGLEQVPGSEHLRVNFDSFRLRHASD